MAIKSRRPVTPADIEAFGDAADQPADTSAPEPTPEPATPEPTPSRRATERPRPPVAAATQPPAAAGEGWPTGVARTVTLRYPDPGIPTLLAELAELDERSQHSIAIRALRRGLAEIQRETAP